MKIAVFQNCSPGMLGGAENSFHVFCSMLSERGNDVFAVFPNRTGDDAKVRVAYRLVKFNERFRIKSYSLSILSIYRVIRDVNPDIIHLADGLSPTDFLILVVNRFFLKKPIFADIRAMYRNPIVNLMVKMQIPVYNLSTRVSFSDPRIMKTALNWLLSRKKVIQGYCLEYTNIDLVKKNVARTKKEKFTFLFVGVLDKDHRYKGLDLLLKAISSGNGSHKSLAEEFDFRIVGSGDSLESFKGFSEKNGLYNVNFRGRVEDLRDEFGESDALILPSRKRGEGFGKVVLEALMNGIPVLVSRYAGSRYIPKEFGVGKIFDPYDTREFVDAMLSLKQECERNVYEEKIKKFQDWLISERERSMNLLLEEYRKAIVI